MNQERMDVCQMLPLFEVYYAVDMFWGVLVIEETRFTTDSIPGVILVFHCLCFTIFKMFNVDICLTEKMITV